MGNITEIAQASGHEPPMHFVPPPKVYLEIELENTKLEYCSYWFHQLADYVYGRTLFKLIFKKENGETKEYDRCWIDRVWMDNGSETFDHYSYLAKFLWMDEWLLPELKSEMIIEFNVRPNGRYTLSGIKRIKQDWN